MMHVPHTHVCLVYNTAISNITPALDTQFKPKQVILVHGIAQQAEAEHLAAVLIPSGIQIQYWPLQDIRHIGHIREQLLSLLAEWEHVDLALNASGGTRPMLMAAYELFQEFAKPVFYVHPETDELTWLHRRDWPGFNVANQIKLPAYLQAYGATVTEQGSRQGVPAQLRALTEVLVQHVQRLAPSLAALNWLAQQAEDSLTSPPLSDRQLRWDELTALIGAFAEQGVLRIEHNRLHFPDEAARFFVNGGWLEAHTYGVLYHLRSTLKDIQDLGRSVAVSRQQHGLAVRNELDVAFLANNRLYIVECKTKRFSTHTASTQAMDTPSAEVLYKLDTLKTVLGGMRSEVMLVSYHDISRWERQRAADLGIEICDAGHLSQLSQQLERWITRTGGVEPE